MSVFDEDSFGQNEFIGEARVELSQLKSRATQRFEVPLQKQITVSRNANGFCYLAKRKMEDFLISR